MQEEAWNEIEKLMQSRWPEVPGGDKPAKSLTLDLVVPDDYSDVSDLDVLSDDDQKQKLDVVKAKEAAEEAGETRKDSDSSGSDSDSEMQHSSDDSEEEQLAFEEEDTVETIIYNASQETGEGVKVGGVQNSDLRAEAKSVLERLAEDVELAAQQPELMPKHWDNMFVDEVTIGYAQRQVPRACQMGSKTGELLVKIADEFPAVQCYGIDTNKSLVAQANIMAKEINDARRAMDPGQVFIPELRFLEGDATDLRPIASLLAQAKLSPFKMSLEHLREAHAAVYTPSESSEESEDEDESYWEPCGSESCSDTDEEKNWDDDNEPQAKRREVATFRENCQVGEHVMKRMACEKRARKSKSFAASFDVVMITHLLCKLGLKQRRQVLQNAKKALRPGGALLVSVTADSQDLDPSYKKLYRKDVKSTKEPRTFHKRDEAGKVVGTTHHFTELELRKLLKANGFKIVKVEKSRTSLLGRSAENTWELYATAALPRADAVQDPKTRCASDIHIAEFLEGIYDRPVHVPDHTIYESDIEEEEEGKDDGQKKDRKTKVKKQTKAKKKKAARELNKETGIQAPKRLPGRMYKPTK
mmetsp:Transcript_71718/g.156087  ORF Transcript_71718/g.156087 Transcript_71718/m.156087 type:complete len:586 (-) Transcript_71718:104-1861(-)